MIINTETGCFVIGPFLRAGSIVIIRLWKWDYVRLGNMRRIVKHVK